VWEAEDAVANTATSHGCMKGRMVGKNNFNFWNEDIVFFPPCSFLSFLSFFFLPFFFFVQEPPFGEETEKTMKQK
jgi:hypothetical protein